MVSLQELDLIAHIHVYKFQMVYPEYVKLRILYHSAKGYKPYTIVKLLEEEGITASKFGITKFIKVYQETRMILQRAGSGRPTKITSRVKQLVEDRMTVDYETTATQLHRMLVENGIDISLSTILRC